MIGHLFCLILAAVCASMFVLLEAEPPNCVDGVCQRESASMMQRTFKDIQRAVIAENSSQDAEQQGSHQATSNTTSDDDSESDDWELDATDANDERLLMSKKKSQKPTSDNLLEDEDDYDDAEEWQVLLQHSGRDSDGMRNAGLFMKGDDEAAGDDSDGIISNYRFISQIGMISPFNKDLGVPMRLIFPYS